MSDNKCKEIIAACFLPFYKDFIQNIEPRLSSMKENIYKNISYYGHDTVSSTERHYCNKLIAEANDKGLPEKEVTKLR